VTTFHLGAIDEIDGLGGIVARGYEQSVCRAIAKCSDEVVGVSEAAATHASALGADAESIHIVPNGVDPAKFRPPNERPVTDKILFVGRLVRNKGPQDFLSALPSVFDRNDDVEAELVGTGPMREQLVSMADELDIAERVHFRGRVPDVAEVMRGSTIFCRPSYSEGMPLTLLEAMATGVPPVVTPVAGVPEVVDDSENGLLVPEGDTEALATALRKLCDHPEQRLALGSAAREYVRHNHNWSVRTDRLLDIYRDGTD
jgi:glycosyltransferase involved in cell wall biosynthesis